MANAVRIVLSVVIGFVVWFVVATLGNFVVRAALPGYAEAEPTMGFTPPMLVARLGLSVVSSIGAGFACAMALRSHPRAVKFFAIVLVVFFSPRALLAVGALPAVVSRGFLGVTRTAGVGWR